MCLGALAGAGAVGVIGVAGVPGVAGVAVSGIVVRSFGVGERLMQLWGRFQRFGKDPWELRGGGEFRFEASLSLCE